MACEALKKKKQKYIQKYSCGIKSAWETFKLAAVLPYFFPSLNPTTWHPFCPFTGAASLNPLAPKSFFLMRKSMRGKKQ